MSGHNKWAQIKHQKGAADARKSREFAKYGRLISLESKKAGGATSAPGLSAAIARAKAINMPKDTIDRAVAKGAAKDSASLEQVVYELYGPAGVAIIIDALTDNKNRTTQEVKHLISKAGFELGAQGSAQWAFIKRPDGSLVPNEPRAEVSGDDETKLGELLDAFDEHDDVQRVYTNAVGYESTADDD